MEGNLRFKVDWASLIVGGKFTVLLCFTLYLRAISKCKLRGAYIWRCDLTEGFLRYDFGGLIFGGAYTWRGLFSEFYGICMYRSLIHKHRYRVPCKSNVIKILLLLASYFDPIIRKEHHSVFRISSEY